MKKEFYLTMPIFMLQRKNVKIWTKDHITNSLVSFLLLGIIWLINAVDIVLKTEWLFYLFIVVSVITVIYAIISPIVIEKRKK